MQPSMGTLKQFYAGLISLPDQAIEKRENCRSLSKIFNPISGKNNNQSHA